jgi:hypothetical protein
VEGRRRVRGAACLIVRLPDGTPGTIALSLAYALEAAINGPTGPRATLSHGL